MVGPLDWPTGTELMCKKITNIKWFHVTIFGQQTYIPSLSLPLTMAIGKRGYLLLLPLLSLLSLLPHCRPYLPSQPRCNDRRWHGRCLCCYRCHLPHFVDYCLPPQFLLLSATAIAIVAAATCPIPLRKIETSCCCW